eukprot:4318596-Prymnesium_polylepis.1
MSAPTSASTRTLTSLRHQAHGATHFGPLRRRIQARKRQSPSAALFCARRVSLEPPRYVPTSSTCPVCVRTMLQMFRSPASRHSRCMISAASLSYSAAAPPIRKTLTAASASR